MKDSLETNGTPAEVQTSEPNVEKVAETPIDSAVQIVENEEENPCTEQSQTIVEPQPEATPLETEGKETSLQTKQQVVDRLKELAAGEEIPEKAEMDLLKILFYKYHNAEMQEAFRTFVAEGGNEEEFQPQMDPLEPEFRAAMQVVRERRAAMHEALEKQKQENLVRKLAILDRIQQIATTPEEASNAFDEFKQLQAEWKEIKAVPAERATELWKNYQLYVENFYDLLKLGHELRDYDFRKNLEIKTRLCEQAELLEKEENVIQAFNQLQGLHQEWKETGPVAKDLRDGIWERFKAASTVINKRHQAHFEEIKAREEQNLAEKTALCEQLEAIKIEDLKTFADWDATTQQIIAMQAQWKTIGYAPQKTNATIFERFRLACDSFFVQKAKFYQEQKDSQNENLAKKKELVEKAESLMKSTDWRATGDALIQLQKQWKEIGAVPRKYSDSLWKRFVGACDHFFEAKQKATASAHKEENANLEQKRGIIEELKALAAKEGEDIIQQVKALQQKWNEVGHVPFREKDKLFKEYREICDNIYGALSATQAKRRLNNFRSSLAQRVEKDATNLSNERNKMMRAYEKMRDEIKTYENNLGFLTSNSKKGNSLVDSMKKKVDKLRDELNLLAQKIKAVDEQIANED